VGQTLIPSTGCRADGPQRGHRSLEPPGVVAHAPIVDRHHLEQFLEQLVGRPTGAVRWRRPLHTRPTEPQPPGLGFIRAEQPNSPQRPQHARHTPLALGPGLVRVVVAARGHPLELRVQKADDALTSGCHTQSLASPNRACDFKVLSN
jgi:hypothetical protein